jgi:hypothetical protein
MAQHQEKRRLRGNLPFADCLHASIFDVLEPTPTTGSEPGVVCSSCGACMAVAALYP